MELYLGLWNLVDFWGRTIHPLVRVVVRVICDSVMEVNLGWGQGPAILDGVFCAEVAEVHQDWGWVFSSSRAQ